MVKSEWQFSSVNINVSDHDSLNLNLNLNTGQAAQLMCPGAEPKNYNNDSCNYIN